MPPIGLAYIAAALREAGHEVTVVDGPGSAPRNFFQFKGVRVRGLIKEDIVERIPKNSEVIALGCMFTSNWIYVREIVKDIRVRFPDAKLIMGGEHVTGFPELSLQQAPLDAVVLGEGEEIVVHLLEHLEKGAPLEELEGVAFRSSDGSIQVKPRYRRIKDIDSISWPAWDLFDIQQYNEVNQPHGASQGRFMPMLATRGCPFQCTFCTSPNMWTTEWIARDYKDVVDEMQQYQEHYRTSDFQFEDLTAIVRNLKAIKKKVKLPAMYDAARNAMDAGINVGCFFIIGFPEDTYRSVLKTYGAMVKCALRGFTNVNLNAYSPQPNTESFQELQANGVITELNDEYLMSLFTFQDFGAKKTSYNPKFGDLELSFLVILGQGLFYVFYFLRKPKRIFDLIYDLFSDSARNKSNKMAKSVLKDAFSIIKTRVKNAFRAA
jgi:radical SAM superfamily enzyme YgiQ (UPF0313 family)